MADEVEKVWVSSNRVDDRVVLFERDPAHPGGEAFVGGGKVDFVARTGTVENLIRQGLLVVIPEPPDGDKKPLPKGPPLFDAVPAAGPGQPIRLGRTIDPALLGTGGQAKVDKQQAQAPTQIASTADVPPPDTK